LSMLSLRVPPVCPCHSGPSRGVPSTALASCPVPGSAAGGRVYLGAVAAAGCGSYAATAATAAAVVVVVIVVIVVIVVFSGKGTVALCALFFWVT
jgi:hypothetical protein